MNESDPKASRAGHPGEGVESICVPGYREGDELSDEELRDGLVALAAIAQDDGRDHDADILLAARDRLCRSENRISELEGGSDSMKETPVSLRFSDGRRLECDLLTLTQICEAGVTL